MGQGVYEKDFRDHRSGFVKFMENKIGFFFKNQIWHIGGLIILFYLGCQLVDFENNSNTFLGISGNSMVG